MKTHSFVLHMKLASSVEDASIYLESLHKRGCNDSIIGIGKLGHISLYFTREAPNASIAIESAVDDVWGVIPDAELLKITQGEI